MIIDASVILRSFFPSERRSQVQALIRDHVSGRTQLAAPALIVHEVTNAIVEAMNRGQITDEDGEAILTAFEDLGIEIEPVTWQQVLPIAQRFDCSAYDAAYLALAQARGEPLTTANLQMYNAVHDDLPWVQWIGDVKRDDL